MSDIITSGELARGWIEAWARKDYQWLEAHLSEGIVHVSPLGTLSGRAHYLSVAIPMAAKSVQQLKIRRVIEQGDEAAVWFVNETMAGEVESCDWITSQNGQIIQVQSFYDSARVSTVLSDEEQSRLNH